MEYVGLYNQTTDLPPYWSLRFRAIMATVLVVFMLFAIFGNLLVVAVIARHRGMQTRTNLFLCNLAVADILCGVFDMPVTLVTLVVGDWIFPNWVCQFNGFTLPLFFVTSIHTLMHISIHKYISITHPFSALLTRRRVKYILCAVWFWAFLSGYLTIHGLNHVYYKPYTTQCGPDYPHDTRTYVHVGFILGTSFFIPLLVIAFCYIEIFRELKGHASRMEKHTTMSRSAIYGQQKRITATLLAVLFVFVLSWTPFILYSLYMSTVYHNLEKVPKKANPFSYICVYLNSAFNPLIYAKGSPAFREGYKQILYFWKWGQTNTESDVSSSSALGRFRAYLRDLRVVFHSSGDTFYSPSGTRRPSLASLTNVTLFSKARSMSNFSLPRDFHFTVNDTNSTHSKRQHRPMSSSHNMLCNCFQPQTTIGQDELPIPVALDSHATAVYYPKKDKPDDGISPLTGSTAPVDDTGEKNSDTREPNPSVKADESNRNSSPSLLPKAADSMTTVSNRESSMTVISSPSFSALHKNGIPSENETNEGTIDRFQMQPTPGEPKLEEKWETRFSNKAQLKQRSSISTRFVSQLFKIKCKDKPNDLECEYSSPMLRSRINQFDSFKAVRKSCPINEHNNTTKEPRLLRRKTAQAKLSRCPSVEKLDGGHFRQRSHTIVTKKRHNDSEKMNSHPPGEVHLAPEISPVEFRWGPNDISKETSSNLRGADARPGKRPDYVRSASDPCVTCQMIVDKLMSRRETKKWQRDSRASRKTSPYQDLPETGSEPRDTDADSGTKGTVEPHMRMTAPKETDKKTGKFKTTISLPSLKEESGLPTPEELETQLERDTKLSIHDSTCEDIPLAYSELETEEKYCLEKRHPEDNDVFSANNYSATCPDPNDKINSSMCTDEEVERTRLTDPSTRIVNENCDSECTDEYEVTTDATGTKRIPKIHKNPHKRWTFRGFTSDGEGSDRETTL